VICFFYVHIKNNIRVEENGGTALWDGNGGRVILNKHRMHAQELGRIYFFNAPTKNNPLHK